MTKIKNDITSVLLGYFSSVESEKTVLMAAAELEELVLMYLDRIDGFEEELEDGQA